MWFEQYIKYIVSYLRYTMWFQYYIKSIVSYLRYTMWFHYYIKSIALDLRYGQFQNRCGRLLKIKDFLKCHKNVLHSWQFWHIFWTYFFVILNILKIFCSNKHHLFRSNKIIKISKLESYSSRSHLFWNCPYLRSKAIDLM
jgi:hypothetical protein